MTETTALDLVVQSLSRIEKKVDTLTETVADRPTRAELEAVEDFVAAIDKRQTEAESQNKGRAAFVRQVVVTCSTSAGIGMVVVGLLQLGGH